MIVQRKNQSALSLGGKKYILDDHHISEILRVPYDGKTLPVGKDNDYSSNFTTMLYSGDMVQRVHLNSTMKTAIKMPDGELKDTYMGKILTLQLFCLYLFLNSGYFISWGLVQLVDKYFDSLFSEYAWAKDIGTYLRQVLKAETKKYVGGYVVLSLYWLCEMTNIIKQHQAEREKLESRNGT